MTGKAPRRLKLWDDFGRDWGCNFSFIFALKIGVMDTNAKLSMQSVEEFSILPHSTKTSPWSRRYTRQTLLLLGSGWCSECGCCDLKKENVYKWNISTFSPSPRVTFHLRSFTSPVYSTSCGAHMIWPNFAGALVSQHSFYVNESPWRTWKEPTYHVRSLQNAVLIKTKSR